MINVNLIGNPNTGKTTLFNSLTRSDEHVGNWHGVTVDEKAKVYKYLGKEIKLVDLPGLYSLTTLSFEEKVASDKVLNGKDVLTINICDESNLERNLYLTLSMMELGLPIVLAVNQIDRKKINHVNFSTLSKLLNLPVVGIDASKKSTLYQLNDAIVGYQKKEYNLPYLKKLPLATVENILRPYVHDMSLTYVAVKMFERDENLIEKLNIPKSVIQKLESIIPKNSIELVAKLRFEYISEIVSKCILRRVDKVYGASFLDKILMNRVLALPFFLLILTGVFYLTFFSVGAFLSSVFSGFIDNCVGGPLIGLCESIFGNGWFLDLVEVGIVGGVGSLFGFLPQIVLLFFFLSVLEDSGYLSRVAFCFEDIFGKVGLSGKSVYTLLMGFGCSTTAAMTARNMEDKNSKIKTAMLTPYMSCSAKLPIYAVLGGAFFGASNVFYILALYLLGVVIALLLSMILEKTFLKSRKQSFILEFPPYRLPSSKRVLRVLFSNMKLFVVRIGSLLVSMNVIVWLLGSFSFKFEYVKLDGGISMLEALGRFFSPIFAPLGFNNWGLVAALFAGLIAKEVVVSSIAMFNGISGQESFSKISQSIKNPESAVFIAGPAAAMSYMVFCLLYSPCLATISVLKGEIGKKWTIIAVILQLVIAYIAAFLTFNIYSLCDSYGLLAVLGSIIGILISIICLSCVIGKIKKRKLCHKGNCETCGLCDKKL